MKPVIEYPIIVEGKYDKIKLDSIVSAHVFVTNGFSVFTSDTEKNMLKELSKKNKIIILTDPDGAGLVIRNYISSFIPKDRIINIYIPQIRGKEKRKSSASKEGYIGVEGADSDMLLSLLQSYSAKKSESDRVTKADLYEMGLFGKRQSGEKRKRLLVSLGLPDNLSSNAMLDAVNCICGKKEFENIVKKLSIDEIGN